MKTRPKNILAAALAALLVAAPIMSSAAERMTVAIPGGYLAAAIERSILTPFARETGASIGIADNTAALRVLEQGTEWDAVLLEAPDLDIACREGWLARLDVSVLASGKNPDPAGDFFPGTLKPCGIGAFVWSTAVLYRADAFKGSGPQSIADFFNPTLYPGKRGLPARPDVILEWALLADGIAPDDIYKVLATSDGEARAYARLDRIKPLAVFWTYGDEPARLLLDGQAAMSTAYAARTLATGHAAGVDFGMIVDRQALRAAFWATPARVKDPARAVALIDFATSAPRQRDLSAALGYGPVRHSALTGLAPERLQRLPTGAAIRQRGFFVDDAFWAGAGAAIARRYLEWRTR